MAGTKVTSSKTGAKAVLSGGVALVTGGSRGIGRAIANRLASLGASVAICGRERAALEDAAEGWAKTGARIHTQPADVTRSADVDKVVAKTETALGPVTLLVTNAGMGLFGPAHEKSEADWDRVHNTNLK